MPFNYNIPKKGTPLLRPTNTKKKTTGNRIVPTIGDGFDELAKSKIQSLNSDLSLAGAPLFGDNVLKRPSPSPSQLQVQTNARQQSLITRRADQLLVPNIKGNANAKASYEQISSQVEECLIKRQSLEPVQTLFQGDRDSLALFYIKIALVSDKVTINRDFTMFTYNSGMTGIRCRTDELISLLERVTDAKALCDLKEAIYGQTIENSIKIMILSILIQKQVKIEKICIDIDENLFEMMYSKITQCMDNREHLQLLCEELDQTLFTIYSENYNESTAKIIDNIGNKVAFPNPIYKRQGSVNYLSTSQAEKKYYRDYIVVVFSTFLLLDCTEFIGIHLAMERNIKLINLVIRELSNKNINLILKRIDPDFVSIIYQRIVELLFFKGWAEYSQISQVLHDVIFCNESVDKSAKSIFYSETVKRLYITPKYRSELHDAFYMLTKSVDGAFIVEVKNRLHNHQVYDLFDHMIVKRLENTKSHDRQNIFVSMLIRDSTLPLLEASTKINLDPEDANSVVNLIQLAQTLSRQNTLTITDGKVKRNEIASTSDAVVSYKSSTNSIIYRICK